LDLDGKPDEPTLRSALSVIALGRGDLKLGALLNYCEVGKRASGDLGRIDGVRQFGPQKQAASRVHWRPSTVDE
jgi:hypothetical protein